MSLAVALEKAASALGKEADAIRDANGDPLRLRRALDPTSGAEVLAWLLAHEPQAGEELAIAWSEAPDGIAYVLAVDESRLPREGRKRLRRLHHRLRGRGVEVPRTEPAPVTAVLPAVEQSLEAALLSALDPTGARLAYLVEPNPGGGVRIFEVIFDTGRGVLECSVYTAARGGARRFLREAQSKPGSNTLAVAPDALRRLLARAADAQPPDRPLPRGFLEWRSHLTAASPDVSTPGEEARAALGAEGSVARAVELIVSGEVGPWPPPEEPLRRLAEKLRELSEGRIVVSGAQRREQVDAAIGAALEEILDARGAATCVERFEETAYVLWKQGREDDARACLAAARSVCDTAPAQSAAARALLEATLGPLLERLREEEDSSLIAKP